ncbi:hypothetical protein MUP01_14230 [Candidatus Bathyarchaeota archaeon]|nr:hypothetical protein [Candidatus Bathyarchaeota archaeon]
MFSSLEELFDLASKSVKDENAGDWLGGSGLQSKHGGSSKDTSGRNQRCPAESLHRKTKFYAILRVALNVAVSLVTEFAIRMVDDLRNTFLKLNQSAEAVTSSRFLLVLRKNGNRFSIKLHGMVGDLS